MLQATVFVLIIKQSISASGPEEKVIILQSLVMNIVVDAQQHFRCGQTSNYKLFIPVLKG